MKYVNKVTHARLLSLMSYNADAGEFTWNVRRNGHGGGIVPGAKVKGTPDPHGYAIIGIDRSRYRKSRLAWFYVYAEWPEGEVDHKNMDISDNRISNLRVATKTQNRANQRVRVDSKSGVKGVRWHDPYKKWCARCNRKTLGYFSTIEEAHAAYVKAAKAEFGDFARAA